MMNILAIKSTGDTTSMSVILQNEINTYSAKHERKDRPNWDTFLENIGLKKIFNLLTFIIILLILFLIINQKKYLIFNSY